MLIGRFGDTTGRPYLEGRLVFPRLNLQHNVSFLVDTGADRTVIMPADAVTLGIDYSALTGNEAVGGIGGTLNMFLSRQQSFFPIPLRGFTST
jgi:translation initiation factor 2B subunit (eIF-2B alpha/beta/delta family)